jgi:hypothetical protein
MDRRAFLINGGASFAGLYLLSPLRTALAQLAPAQAEPVHPTWLKRFDDRPLATLLRRRKYRLIMNQCFAGMTAPFWWDLPIHYTAHAFLSNPGTAMLQHNRYFIAEGCKCHYGRSRAMLWIDTHFNPSISARPSAALAVIDVSRRGRFLWVVSNQPLVDESPHIPTNLRKNLHNWILSRPPKRWEGGRLDYFDVLDSSSGAKTPIPKAFGVPAKRCAPTLQSTNVT